jgi:hypothetical protein
VNAAILATLDDDDLNRPGCESLLYAVRNPILARQQRRFGSAREKQ